MSARVFFALVLLIGAGVYLFIGINGLFDIAPRYVCQYIPVAYLDYQYCAWTRWATSSEFFQITMFRITVAVLLTVGATVVLGDKYP